MLIYFLIRIFFDLLFYFKLNEGESELYFIIRKTSIVNIFCTPKKISINVYKWCAAQKKQSYPILSEYTIYMQTMKNQVTIMQ